MTVEKMPEPTKSAVEDRLDRVFSQGDNLIELALQLRHRLNLVLHPAPPAGGNGKDETVSPAHSPLTSALDGLSAKQLALGSILTGILSDLSV